MVTKKTSKKKTARKKATKKPQKPVKLEGPKPRGRPTKYDPDFCDVIIEAMEKGFSKEAAAAHVRISKDTLYEWAKKYPEFSDALKLGVQLSQIFWEKKGIDNLEETYQGTKLNSTNWIFNMKNRFNWRDKKDLSLEGGDEDKPIRSMGFNLIRTPDELDAAGGDDPSQYGEE
jgi:transposase